MEKSQDEGHRGVDKESWFTERRQGHWNRSINGAGERGMPTLEESLPGESTASTKVLRQVLYALVQERGVTVWLEVGGRVVCLQVWT